jgi:hypothetical protein
MRHEEAAAHRAREEVGSERATGWVNDYRAILAFLSEHLGW